MKKTYDLMFACLGNGITVYNRNEQQYGDYKIIAHISDTGSIKYRCELPGTVKAEIEKMATFHPFTI